MQNQHPIIRALVRVLGVRNHRPHTRQPNNFHQRDYPPAFIMPKPNDKLSDGWYADRDYRREVTPPEKIQKIEAVNDSKYPVPGWGTQWTLTADKDQQFLRDSSVGLTSGRKSENYDYPHYCDIGDRKRPEA